MQHLEVMADGRLGQVERVGQVAHAGLAAGVGGHQGHQPQPDRIGEGLQQRRDLLGLLQRQRLRDSGEQQAAGSACRRQQDCTRGRSTQPRRAG